MVAAYGQSAALEGFRCNYGFNGAFTQRLRASDLHFVAFAGEGDLRAVELPAHRFYLATLFLPQMRLQARQPHPLITAFLQAAAG